MGSQVSPQAVEDTMKRLAQQKPLIQCITNFVSMDLMANVLLAAGASPAMVSPPFLEVGDNVQQGANAAYDSNVGEPGRARMHCLTPAHS